MKFGKKTIALIGAVAMLSSVAACGSTSAGDGGSTGSSDKKVELTVWSWDSTLPRTVKGFEAKNPNIKVKVTNAGTNKDEYNALSNAIEAGSGAPDIAQIEYYALPEYVIRGHLENLSDLGASDFKDFYTPGTWSSVNINDGVYALPMDSGPMAWFYNKGVFDKAGVDPTQVRTWDDFYEAAKKIRAVDSYITSDSGDAGFFDSMAWLAGATPFETSKDGGTVTINLTGDKNVKTFTDFWQKMIDEDLIDTKTVGWTDDWNKGLDDGSIASLLTGAWMPYNLLSGAPNGDGKWRIAQMPTADGSETNSENGGSSLVIVKSDDKVDLKNVGTNTKEYTQLDNAIEAGSGAPDVAQVEYYAIPQYAIKGNLLDITDKTSGYSDFYTPGPWASVQFAGKVYGLPMDSGPMAFFYNKEVFDKAGVDAEQIKTWDQYYDAAKKIHALGDNYYITSDTGDAGFFDSMTWLAGAKPFQTSSDGSEVTVNLTEDKGVKTFTDFWQKLLDEGLLDTKTAGWSEDWFKGMVDGTIASLFTGAWMPANLANSAADGAGKWRVTQMPTADGSTTNSENGGSSLAVLASTKKADAAYQFIEYANHGDGVATRVAGGAFPADKASMESDSFKNTTTVKNADGEDVDYFGGQKYNEVLAQAAENVSSDYQFLPYEVKARTIFGDYLGKSYTGDQKLTDGIAAWQKALQDYGKDQGFTVK